MSKRSLTERGIIVGDELAATEHHISPEWVSSYLDAMGLRETWPEPIAAGAHAPPALLSLLWFKPAEQTYAFGPERVQVSHELSCRSALRVGATITASGRVVDKYQRRGRAFAVFETVFHSSDGDLVARALSHLMVPDGED